MQLMSVDLGFGYTKATNGRRSALFPSLIGATDGLRARDRSLLPRRDALHLQAEIGGRELLFGNTARRRSHDPALDLDIARFVRDAAPPLTLIALAQLADPGVPVQLMTGLPTADVVEWAPELVDRLKGEHHLTTIDARGYRRPVTIEIAAVQVLPQPFGSLYDLVLDDAGRIADRSVAESKVGIIDVGFRTTDFTVADRTTFLRRASGGTDSGMAWAFSLIADKLRETTGAGVEPARLHDAVKKGQITVRGSSFDVTRLTDYVLARLAEEIAASARELWADESGICRVRISGGGCDALAPYLAPLLDQPADPIDYSRDHRMNNVAGFQKFATHISMGRSGRTGGSARRRADPTRAATG